MEVVIKIPDEAYELLKSKPTLDNIAESIIANGTVLPKNHGRLVDENKALAGLIFGKHLDDMKCGEVAKIFDASVVIEADKG